MRCCTPPFSKPQLLMHSPDFPWCLSFCCDCFPFQVITILVPLVKYQQWIFPPPSFFLLETPWFSFFPSVFTLSLLINVEDQPSCNPSLFFVTPPLSSVPRSLCPPFFSFMPIFPAAVNIRRPLPLEMPIFRQGIFVERQNHASLLWFVESIFPGPQALHFLFPILSAFLSPRATVPWLNTPWYPSSSFPANFSSQALQCRAFPLYCRRPVFSPATSRKCLVVIAISGVYDRLEQLLTPPRPFCLPGLVVNFAFAGHLGFSIFRTPFLLCPRPCPPPLPVQYIGLSFSHRLIANSGPPSHLLPCISIATLSKY